jgi:hypothetical protein
VIQRILRQHSNHPEPLHQDRIARCDRSDEAVLRSLIVLQRGTLRLKGFSSVGIVKFLPMSELAEREGFEFA